MSAYVIHPAKTARSTCVDCHEKIDKDVLRLGQNIGISGQKFSHLECAQAYLTLIKEQPVEDVVGFQDLSPEEKRKFKAAVKNA